MAGSNAAAVSIVSDSRVDRLIVTFTVLNGFFFFIFCYFYFFLFWTVQQTKLA